jgi:hypothetical protein
VSLSPGSSIGSSRTVVMKSRSYSLPFFLSLDLSINNNNFRIGDWAPERPTFQILIALCSGPRFLLILLQWLVTRQRPRSRTSSSSPSSDPAEVKGRKRTAQAGGLAMADWVALIGVGRTFCWYVRFSCPFPFPFKSKLEVKTEG